MIGRRDPPWRAAGRREVNPDDAVPIVKRDFGDEVLRTAASLVAPIYFGPGDGAGNDAINNGTIFFLDCGEGPFGVTADHVLRRFLERKRTEPELLCRIADLPFAPADRLIDRDAYRDIATFRIEPWELTRLGTAVHRPRYRWPPERPECGQGVLFAGYPGCERRVVGPRTVEFGLCLAAPVATAVNDRAIICRFEREHWIEAPGSAPPPANRFLGGLSGAPLWTVAERGGSVAWRLGGVISAFSQNWDLLFAKHPACIRADGRLTPRLPGDA